MGVPDDLPGTALATIEALRAERRARRESEARDFRLIAHLADLYSDVDEVDSSEPALPGRERLVALGGAGTPEVAEGCALELAADLHVRVEEATALIAAALDVRHRLPALWRMVQELDVPVHHAQHIAFATRELDRDAAGLVDLELSRMIVGMSFRRVKKTVAGVVLRHLPPEEAEQKRQDAQEVRGVWIAQSEAGVADVAAVIDAADAVQLDAQLDRLVQVLRRAGHVGTPNALRAKALGLMATPALATQLLQADALDQLPVGEEFERLCERAGQAGHVCGTITVDPEKLLPATQVVLHLTDTTLQAGEGIVRGEHLQPLLAGWLRDLFGHHRVTVRPVIDQNHQVPSDAYECPATMREAVTLRSPYEVFPWSTRQSTGLDLDHTTPWKTPRQARGPLAGLTHPDNLGPLSRRAHRAKTHFGWHLAQPLPGIFLWQTPLGYRYLTTASRTLDLGRPDVAASRRHLETQILETTAA
ncbi:MULTISPECIES: HNH endonuclease signature motif containing protein [unclassified Luteococcus]|uniref:HNH endonuclease signature motif containing protein n=1 Tax=unclassified Luteococcus TaxID=2639923 RepID=UPI00313C30AB